MFLWFSSGFPVVFLWFSYGFWLSNDLANVATTVKAWHRSFGTRHRGMRLGVDALGTGYLRQWQWDIVMSGLEESVWRIYIYMISYDIIVYLCIYIHIFICTIHIYIYIFIYIEMYRHNDMEQTFITNRYTRLQNILDDLSRVKHVNHRDITTKRAI